MLGSTRYTVISSDIVTSLYSVPFAKYAMLTCQTRDNIRAPFLLADDRILLYSGADDDMSPISANAAVWQVVQVSNFICFKISQIPGSKHVSDRQLADSRKLLVRDPSHFVSTRLSPQMERTWP